MVCGAGPGPPTSIVPGSIRAPHSSIISRVAIACASIACSGCSRFSKRLEASLRRPSRSDVRWMLAPFQFAASISTRVVVPATSERAPPITPAIEVGPSRVGDQHDLGVQRSRLAVERLHALAGLALRTVSSCARRPASRSKACSGWPVSSIT